ncbi:PREDICTED: chondroitin sulfate synthase 1 [Ceratosolen solmsi marchali]|uniref:Hexosyltransferase n=1 Tax=Ceratosolen solmsi marchali TaxID=326594 RepID=A0AAJ6YP64_9HYME|nr:PREDICTED: chondroitin sulfate synthase 1 [Ceratosolen solmsi marchali]
MRKRRGLSSAVLGLGCGLLLGLLLLQRSVPDRRGVSPHLLGTTTSRREISSGGLLFVGVMTARKYLGTRAKAVYESWGREVPGQIGFFSSEASRPPVECPDLPIIALPRVDDSYPPQKKSFLMLQHMWTRYGERFEWFLRADDDLYVRMDRLEHLLRSVDSRRPEYIGQAGRGNSREFGRLSLEYDENFCMGGPGVIMSRETLRRMVPHIKHCLSNLYTAHEDVELGRCVRKFAGVSCTWSYEMQSILYHNSSGDLAFTGKLKSKEVHRAISMHPVKSPPHMYRLHNYMRGLKIQELQQKRIELQRDMERMARSLSSPFSTDAYYPSGRKIQTYHRLPPWDFVSRSEYSLVDSNPRRRIHSDLREGLEDVTREVMASINACSRQRGRLVEERQALYGYRRRTAVGVDTVLDLLLIYKKYRGRKLTLPVRRHLYLHQHFTGLETREVPSDDLDKRVIHFIVPVSGRQEAMRRFLQNYERVCLSRFQHTKLLVVVYSSNELETISISRLIERLKRNYGQQKVQMIEGVGNFSRARALDQGTTLLREDDLMFFIDVDISFEMPILQRIRRNTLKAKRIYFPVVFSQYNPKIIFGISDQDIISDVNGFWRLFGFGIVAIYKSDYDAMGGFDLSIEGWGKEDVDLFEKAVQSELHIFRSSDLDLIHVFHGINCDKSLKEHQLIMCKGTRADTYASTQQLASLIYRNSEYLDFARMKRLVNMTSPSA